MIYRYEGKDKSKQGLSVRIGRTAQLWLARMCVGEAGKNCTVDEVSLLCWAIVNRYLLHPGLKKWIPLSKKHGGHEGNDFISMIRMFSQPINPRWAEGGDKAEKYKDIREGRPAALKRRKAVTNMLWRDIPGTVKYAVRQFSEGKLFPPEVLTKVEKARISNWAALKSTPDKFPWGFDVNGNWFFEDQELVDGIVICSGDEDTAGEFVETFVDNEAPEELPISSTIEPIG